jgi:hypothetical protein
MDVYRKYAQRINHIDRGAFLMEGVSSAFVKWVRGNKQQLSEIFQIDHGNQLRNDLAQFLKAEFEKGNIRPIHAGQSTTEFHPNDWVEEIANDLFNRLIQYFETTRSQTERDMYSPVPLEYD